MDRLSRIKGKRSLRGVWTLAAGLTLLLGASQAAAVCLDAASLRGVNLSGAEFNSKKLPGEMYRDYTYPSGSEMDYYDEKGVNAVRLPIRWERVQRTLYGELDGQEVGAIKKTLNQARERDICLILDIHNYGLYNGEPIGSPNVPVEAFHDLWRRLALELDDPAYLVLDLMNEPFKLDIAAWGDVAQSTVNVLREAGAKQMILVSGGRWSGVHEWSKTISGSSNAETFAGFQDPLDRTVLQVHQYADDYYSGTKQDCHEPSHFDRMFESIEQWARENDQQLFLGEFGMPASEQCLAVLDHMLALVDNPDVWRGWTYWAGGAWWGDYFLSIAPQDGKDSEQMEVVEPYLDITRCRESGRMDCPKPPQDVKVGSGS